MNERQHKEARNARGGLLLAAAVLLLPPAAWSTARAADEPPSGASSTLAAHGPRVRAESTEIDLGIVARGTSPRARFALHNLGDEVLQIIEAKPG